MVLVKTIFAVSALACSACSVGSNLRSDTKPEEVIERTRRTTETYSLFAWNDVPEAGKIKDGWSAEFHQGNLHRLETPGIRVVADCDAMTGTSLDVATGKKFSDTSIAKAACGINTNFPIHSAEWLGRYPTRFGEANRIRITATDAVRTYDVLDNGALVAALYADGEGRSLVKNHAIAVLATVPRNIFSEESLIKSFVPAQFQSKPEK